MAIQRRKAKKKNFVLDWMIIEHKKEDFDAFQTSNSSFDLLHRDEFHIMFITC